MNYLVMSTPTIQELEDTWNELVAQDLYDNGHQYSGTIGMLGENIKFLDKEFMSLQNAIEFIIDTHDKGECAIAVRLEGKEKADRLDIVIGDGGHKANNTIYVVGGWCSS